MSGPAASRPDPRARPSGSTLRLDDAAPTTVVLVRHGVTELTLGGAFSGSSVPGPALSAHGRTQAAQAADLVRRIGRTAWADLPRVSRVVASPMVRTQETGAFLGRRLGLHVETDARFAELDFGDHEGRALADVEAQDPAWLAAFYSGADGGRVAPPGGESLVDLGARVRAGLLDLRAAHAGQTVAVVSHAMAIRAAVGLAAGTDPSAWLRTRITPASVSIVRLWPDDTAELTVVGCPPDL